MLNVNNVRAQMIIKPSLADGSIFPKPAFQKLYKFSVLEVKTKLLDDSVISYCLFACNFYDVRHTMFACNFYYVRHTTFDTIYMISIFSTSSLGLIQVLL